LEPVEYFYRLDPPKKPGKSPYKLFEKDVPIKGVYERFFENTVKSRDGRQFKSRTYLIRQPNGKLAGIPGTGSRFRAAMAQVEEGSKVIITYNGSSTIKKGDYEGTVMQNFTVLASKRKAA